ncbi:DUF6508 domain-containing protein [Vibrio sp. PNB22_4_1]
MRRGCARTRIRKQRLCWMIRLVRSERFWDGAIEENIRNGAVTLWLKNMSRLLELDMK